MTTDHSSHIASTPDISSTIDLAEIRERPAAVDGPAYRRGLEAAPHPDASPPKGSVNFSLATRPPPRAA